MNSKLFHDGYTGLYVLILRLKIKGQTTLAIKCQKTDHAVIDLTERMGIKNMIIWDLVISILRMKKCKNHNVGFD